MIHSILEATLGNSLLSFPHQLHRLGIITTRVDDES